MTHNTKTVSSSFIFMETLRLKSSLIRSDSTYPIDIQWHRSISWDVAVIFSKTLSL